LLAANNQGHRQPGRKVTPSVLAGLVFDAAGNRYTPTHAVKKGRRYRYYTSQAIIQKRRKASHLDRIPAKELEQVVCSRIQTLLGSPQEMAVAYTESALLNTNLGRLLEAAQAMAEKWSELTTQQSTKIIRGILHRVVLHSSELEIEVDLEAMAAWLLQQDSDDSGDEHSETKGGNHSIMLKCSFRLARRSGELRLVLPGSPADTGKPSSPLLRAMVTAHGWRERIIAGEIHSIEQLAAEAKLNPRYASRTLRLAALSPDLVDDVVLNRPAGDLSLRQFMQNVPLNWSDQAALFLS
jgi:site-specific DNA recombinase